MKCDYFTFEFSVGLLLDCLMLCCLMVAYVSGFCGC